MAKAWISIGTEAGEEYDVVKKLVGM